MEKIKNLIKDLHYAKLELVNKYIVFNPYRKKDTFCAKIIEIKNGLFRLEQNINKQIIKSYIKFENIIKIATTTDLENIPGTEFFSEEKIKNKLNIKNYYDLIGNYIVFKIEGKDSEECAKVIKYESNCYKIKQSLKGLTIQGYIKLFNIIRNASINDLENIPGTDYYSINQKIKEKPNIIGFKSNLIRHD